MIESSSRSALMRVYSFRISLAGCFTGAFVAGFNVAFLLTGMFFFLVAGDDRICWTTTSALKLKGYGPVRLLLMVFKLQTV